VGVEAVSSGTSMSCPHVAGAAALILSMEPKLQPDDVKTVLVDRATSMRQLAMDSNGSHPLLLNTGLETMEPTPAPTPTPTSEKHARGPYMANRITGSHRQQGPYKPGSSN